MAKKKAYKLTRAQRRLVWEMAHDQRVIFIMKHKRQWMGIRYAINSFPMRNLHGSMVARLALHGYLTLDKRGYYILTAKGQFAASLTDIHGSKP